jgi:hypothetical protein
VLKQVGGRGPLASFAEDHDRRAAEAKDRFLFAAPEGQVEGVDLRYPANR